MSEPNLFEDKVKADIQRSESRLASTEKWAERMRAERGWATNDEYWKMVEKQKKADLEQAKEQRRDGTRPEHIWGDEAGKLCQQFIDFMAKRNFPFSETFTRKTEDEESGASTRVLRGYAVGVLNLPPPNESWANRYYANGTPSLVRDTYLCEDGTLLYMGQPLPITYRDEVAMPRVGHVRQGRRTPLLGTPIEVETDGQFSHISHIRVSASSPIFQEVSLEDVLNGFADKAAQIPTKSN